MGASDYACRVCIHERADIGAAERYWADLVGVRVDALLPTTLKRRNAKTLRKNTGEAYRGCLTINDRKSATLVEQVEGIMLGVFYSLGAAGATKM